jgi:hypothetical protein
VRVRNVSTTVSLMVNVWMGSASVMLTMGSHSVRRESARWIAHPTVFATVTGHVSAKRDSTGRDASTNRALERVVVTGSALKKDRAPAVLVGLVMPATLDMS